MILNVDPQLSQWDVSRSVSVSDSNATHIHFANQGDSKAVIIKITDGSAKIPDYLLQTGKSVIAYAVLDGVTLGSKSFPVRKRERPENYVYEEDQRNYIYELVIKAENAVMNANTATENATNAAAGANIATKYANDAATSATDASAKANLAAQNANEATSKAANAVKRMMVVGAANGTNITLDNAIEQPLVGLRVFGKTTQDGTPTPDAPVELMSVANPIVGVYGKNLFTSYSDSTKTENGVTFTVNSNGSITINGTATASAQFNIVALYELTPAICPGASYIISGATNAAAIHIYEMKGNWVRVADTMSETKFVLSDDATGLLIRYVVQPNTTVNNLTVYPMLRLVSVADSTYEQGRPAQIVMLNHTLPGIPVTSGGNYTDANGQQWICDEVDFARGVYVQRVSKSAGSGIKITDKTVAGDKSSRFNYWLSNAKIGNGLAMSSHFRKASTWIYGDSEDNAITSNPQTGLVAFFTTSMKDYTVAEFKEFLSVNNVVILYALATPIETPLSAEELAAYASLHTYKDNTTVSNDAGAWMALEYVMDAKKYIDSMISAGILEATLE